MKTNKKTTKLKEEPAGKVKKSSKIKGLPKEVKKEPKKAVAKKTPKVIKKAAKPAAKKTKARAKEPIEIILLNKRTKETRPFISRMAAALYLGCSKSTLANFVDTKKAYGGYLIQTNQTKEKNDKKTTKKAVKKGK